MSQTLVAATATPDAAVAALAYITDFMINIQLLVWGARHAGPTNDLRMDADPATTWMQMAIAHARQVAKNHVRPDGSTYHIVEYNPFDGTVNRRYTYQGYADGSTWSRGQAWALAGFSKLYEETQLPEFRDTAIKVTDKYLQLLDRQEQQLGVQRAGAPPAADADAAAWDRWVPMWDFDAPYKQELDGPRDTSGGAVAAWGMLHLARALAHQDPSGSQKYLCAAVSTLRALASSKYLVRPGVDPSAGITKHATGGMPLGLDIDVGLITADYYFLAALQLCDSWTPCRQFASGADAAVKSASRRG
jgi:unsaturated chondroitin disaccharide hydrolase